MDFIQCLTTLELSLLLAQLGLSQFHLDLTQLESTNGFETYTREADARTHHCFFILFVSLSLEEKWHFDFRAVMKQCSIVYFL